MKEGYTRKFTIYKRTYTRGITDQKLCINMHVLSCKEKRVHVGNLILNRGIGSLVLVLNGFGPWYLEDPKPI